MTHVSPNHFITGFNFFLLLMLLAIPLALALWAGSVSAAKGRSGVGWGLLTFVATVAGLVPGLIMIVIVYLLPDDRRR